MNVLTGHAATIAALTMAAGYVMTRVAQRQGRLRLRREHRCVACGTLVESRVCPRCGEPR